MNSPLVEGRPLEDAELVQRAKDGDVGAYEQLVQRHQAIAVRVAYLVVRSAPDAEDAAQEAFVKAFLALGRFRRGAPFRPWLLAIVTNEARSRARSMARRDALRLRLEAQPGSGDAAPSPEAAALAASDTEVVVAALDRLSEKDRIVITYRYLLGMSEKETAVTLGVRKGTVKSRLSRALDRLRLLLSESER